jgi:predicted  nucleic acid-binding Zn-ribbon protein
MYVNKCIKCGREFETKNPKRVICPDCLYPDKSMMVSSSSENDTQKSQPAPQEPLNGYSAGGNDEAPRYYSAGGNDEQPRYRSNNNRNYSQGSYSRNNYSSNNRQGGYQNRQQGGYSRDNRNYGQNGYSRNNYNNNRQSGYQNRPQQGGFSRNNNRRPQQGGFNRNNRRPQMRKAPKQLLVSKEQLEQIELLYKLMLPLPNPDCHEVIGEKIGLEPRKVFFGINLIRQKMMLPKLPFPKRKLAISPDQLFAIKNLYEPLLPLPPIGCHKIIAAQLKMDEWRVHVGIGLIRSQMGLERWNEDRADLPEELKNKQADQPETEVKVEATEEVKPKRGRKPKKTEESPE